ncbi:tetratricopeptide repeat protein [Pararhizobium sp. O133]|uniref:tetratricopeptide repeat protein n=1 Tax=Pararhizobium sp. O133 TaxID=3449278 RepID=UPI003F688829
MSGKQTIERSTCERIGHMEGQAEVERLLTDPRFQSPERNRSFLRFISTEFFEGRAEAIKAYTIAVDVFGRPPNFDPSVDPIVRIEATRLRAALTQYYDAHGNRTNIRIDLPRGRYVPVFTRVVLEETNSDADAEINCPLPVIEIEPAAPTTRSRQWAWISSAGVAFTWLLAGGGIAAYLITGGFGTWRQGSFTYKPMVSVVMDGDSNPDAENIRDYLMVAMSQFQTVRLSSATGTSASVLGQWAGSSLASSLRGKAPQQIYQIVLKYETVAHERLVWWQVENAETGEALLSGVERQLERAVGITPKNWELASSLARKLAGTRGVINNIETLRDLDDPSLGNGCVLRAKAALGHGDAQEIAGTRDCLELTLTTTPNDAGAKAELAIVLLAMDSPEVPTLLSDRARKLANDAVLLAPFSDRSRYALMISQFQTGQILAAIETGYTGMTLNPNNSDIPARLGLYLFTIGRWEEGKGLAFRATRLESDVLPDVLLTRALSAYRIGRFEDALSLSLQLGPSRNFLANVIEVAATGQLGRVRDASEAMRSLSYNRGFEDLFRASMTARQFTPKMTELLITGLRKAIESRS